MFRWSLVFFLLVIVLGFLGFGGYSFDWAKVLFFIALMVFLLVTLFGDPVFKK